MGCDIEQTTSVHPPAPATRVLPPLAEHWESIAPATHASLLECLAKFYDSAAGAYPANTRRAWISDSRVFAQWCIEQDCCPLPATPETVAQFLDAQFCHNKKSLATVERYKATIATMHRDGAGVANPCDSRLVKHKIRELRGKNEKPQTQAAPLRWEHLHVALKVLDDRPLNLLTKALACVAYDTLARRSDLCALKVKDFAVQDDGSGILRMRRVKGQHKNRWRKKFLHPTTVTHVRAWLDCMGQHDGKLFRGLYRNTGNVYRVGDHLSGNGVVRALRRVAAAAGLNQVDISGHSCRVGSAHDMFAAGISMPKLMAAGDWSSERMPARYTEALGEKQGGIAEAAMILGR